MIGKISLLFGSFSPPLPTHLHIPMIIWINLVGCLKVIKIFDQHKKIMGTYSNYGYNTLFNIYLVYQSLKKKIIIVTNN